MGDTIRRPCDTATASPSSGVVDSLHPPPRGARPPDIVHSSSSSSSSSLSLAARRRCRRRLYPQAVATATATTTPTTMIRPSSPLARTAPGGGNGPRWARVFAPATRRVPAMIMVCTHIGREMRGINFVNPERTFAARRAPPPSPIWRRADSINNESAAHGPRRSTYQRCVEFLPLHLDEFLQCRVAACR